MTRDSAGTYACFAPEVKCCGARHVSVTTALGVLSKPALIQWAANCAADAAAKDLLVATGEFEHADGTDELTNIFELLTKGRDRWARAHVLARDKAAARGTEVHRIVEALAQGREPATIPPEVLPYLDALRRFCDVEKPIVVHSESVVSSRKGYAGTLDAIHRVANARACLAGHADCGEPGLVIRDWKTRGNESKARLYGEEVLQLAAYRYATWMRSPDGTIRKMPRIDAAEVVLLWPPTGPSDPGYRIERVRADREALAMFFHALALYRYRREQEGDRR